MAPQTLKPLSTALLALAMAGCVQAPPPGSSTETWIAPKEARKPDTVWREVRAQKTDLSQPLALPAIADIALQNNAATKKAWHDARAASEQVRYAQGYFMPSITGIPRRSAAGQNQSAAPLSMRARSWSRWNVRRTPSIPFCSFHPSSRSGAPGLSSNSRPITAKRLG